MEKYLINPNQKICQIDKNIYGSFSEHLGRCIYDGLYVGENSPIPNVGGMRTDIVNALKEMGLPVLRWPGGCFADTYHWKDGIGPKEQRTKIVNTRDFVEDNSFGTHEFFELCRQIGCEPYVNGNVGSGTVQEMSEWIEYMNYDGASPMAELRRKNGREKPWYVKYFGIGNENWGCGGNMTPEYYADEYKKYATFVRTYNKNHPVYKIACGPDSANYHWTETMMKKACGLMDGLSLHYYTWTGHNDDGIRALDFNDEQYYTSMQDAYRIDELITRHSEIMNRYDPEKRVALIIDEWGTWHRSEAGTNVRFLYQQNAIRDGLIAALSLNIFNKHADRVRMANIAQTVNVLQAAALTDGEEMILTPTYYAFKMYKDHQQNMLLGSYITTQKIGNQGKLPQLIESASMRENGTIISTIVNTSLTESVEVHCQIADYCVENIWAEILTGEAHDHNSFDHKNVVGLSDFTNFSTSLDGFSAVLPACSVVKFVIEKK